MATAKEQEPVIGYVDPVFLAGRRKGLPWNGKIYPEPTGDSTVIVHITAVPQETKQKEGSCQQNQDK